MSKYAVVIERGPSSFGAYVPDLPGCVAVGDTQAEAERLIQEAIVAHLEALRRSGDPVPPPTSSITMVEASAGSS